MPDSPSNFVSIIRNAAHPSGPARQALLFNACSVVQVSFHCLKKPARAGFAFQYGLSIELPFDYSQHAAHPFRGPAPNGDITNIARCISSAGEQVRGIVRPLTNHPLCQRKKSGTELVISHQLCRLSVQVTNMTVYLPCRQRKSFCSSISPTNSSTNTPFCRPFSAQKLTSRATTRRQQAHRYAGDVSHACADHLHHGSSAKPINGAAITTARQTGICRGATQ